MIDPSSPDFRALLGWAELRPLDPVESGSLGSWTLTYHVGSFGVDDGGAVRVARRFASDFGDPQTRDPSGANYLTAATSGEATLAVDYNPQAHVRPWQKAVTVRVRDGFLRGGETLTVTIGDRSGGGPGAEAQTFCESRFHFKVLVDCFGTGVFTELEPAGELEVVAGPATSLRLIAPADVTVGEPFTVVLRAHDRWGNVADGYASTLAVAAPGLTHVPASISLSAADRGLLRIPDVRAADAGTWHLVAHDDGGLTARSNPITAHPSAPRLRRYWGDLHGQSGEGVGTGTVEEYFSFARDRACLDFAGHQTNCFQITRDAWTAIKSTVRDFHEPGRFVTFLGYEWSGLTAAGGDRNVYFLGDDGPLHRASHALVDDTSDVEDDCYPLDDLYERFAGRADVLLVPHVGGRWADLSRHDEALEPVVEIASSHGEFEWLLADAIERELHVGIVCGSDEHKGRPGASFAGRGLFGVRGGLTCVFAEELTREAVWQALRQRRCYGTTGERISLDVEAGGVPMGGRLVAAAPPSFRVSVRGTDEIERVELRRGMSAVGRWPPESGVERSEREVRVAWSGARTRGRDRGARWDGEISVAGTSIVSARPHAFDSPAEGILQLSGERLSFVSATAGDTDGVVLELDPSDTGTLEFASPLASFDLALRGLGREPVVHAAGGLDLQVVVERNPLGVGRAVDIELSDGALPDRPTPYHVLVVQRDGAKAWSSPILVVPSR